ncbi:nitroreductase family protein [Anaerosinus sp.]|uniref:nitroreductase family protein n=1 Tax=Selenobaculum sp. TaxID=3074374 RepID=UPI0015A8C362
MILQEAIEKRRSVRKYTNTAVEKEKIEHLILNASKAPSAMNLQPWAFAVIENTELLDRYSTEIKKSLIEKMNTEKTILEKYRSLMEKETFHIFHHAPALIVIYAKKPSLHPHEDCALAAQNLMLTAADLELGTCWIGFSIYHFNSSKIKTELNIPEEYEAIAPIVIGYPQTNHLPIPKKDPEILCWKR